MAKRKRPAASQAGQRNSLILAFKDLDPFGFVAALFCLGTAVFSGLSGPAAIVSALQPILTAINCIVAPSEADSA